MIKLLLASDILVEATLDSSSKSSQLIEKCKQEEGFQAWMLSTAIQELIDQNLNPDQLQQIVAGIPQIPVNAYLNAQALESSHGYKLALYQASCETFKIDFLVTMESHEDSKGISLVTSEEAMELEDDYNIDKVDFMNLNLGLHPIFDQVDEWYMEIIQNTAFAGGNHVDQFEKEFADFCQSKYAIGVSNGTDALLLALQAMGIGPGDEVITVPNTFIATTAAISHVGAKAVFVDVLPDSYCMDPALLAFKITKNTKAIVPVHLYGQIADISSILTIAKKHDIKI